MHLRRHLARPHVCTLVAALAAACLQVVAFAPAATSADGCSRATKISRLGFTGRERSSTEQWVKDAGKDPKKVSSSVQRDVAVGGYSLEVVACKQRDGSWQMLRMYNIAGGPSDVELTVKSGKITKVKPATSWPSGFYYGVSGATSSAVTVTPIRCLGKGSKLAALNVVKALLGLPLPYKPATAVGLYFLNLALPSAGEKKYYCGALAADVALSYHFTKKGVATWDWSGHPSKWAESVPVASCARQACWTSYIDEMTISAA